MPPFFALLLALAPAGDLLMLETLPVGPGLPPGWQQRAVRGRRSPGYAVRDDSGGRVFHIAGTGAAAWVFRELPEPVSDAEATLRWEWRVHHAPPSADLLRKEHDDSPLRIFVVFGRMRDLRSSAHAIFYTWGNEEPEGFARLSHGSRRIAVVRLAGREHADGSWHAGAVSPFEDYRRFWEGEPPPITTVGVMQDTDQTGESAAADLRSLGFAPADGAAEVKP